jgi:hypothetical protein
MTKDRWLDIKGNIKDKFKIEDEGNEHVEDEGGVDIEYLIFQGPLGRMRMELVSRPVVLDKKTNYSKRIGSETEVKYIYSETERNEKLFVYKWEEDQDDWIEIEAKNFEL